MNIKSLFNKIFENKRLFTILWLICLVLFILLFVRHGKYKPARVNYNKGVKCFREGDYEDAEYYFQQAMWRKHTKRDECKFRINKALSITTPITPESVTPENLDESIERLEEARDFLTQNDCAHKNDSKGHNRKAQKLKEEIDEYIEFLKSNNPKPENNKDPSDDGKKDDSSTDEEEKRKALEEEKRRQMEEQQKLKEVFDKVETEGLKERNENLELYNAWNSKSIYYSGKNW